MLLGRNPAVRIHERRADQAAVRRSPQGRQYRDIERSVREATAAIPAIAIPPGEVETLQNGCHVAKVVNRLGVTGDRPARSAKGQIGANEIQVVERHIPHRTTGPIVIRITADGVLQLSVTSFTLKLRFLGPLLNVGRIEIQSVELLAEIDRKSAELSVIENLERRIARDIAEGQIIREGPAEDIVCTPRTHFVHGICRVVNRARTKSVLSRNERLTAVGSTAERIETRA